MKETPRVKKKAVKVQRKQKWPKDCAVQDDDPSMALEEQPCLAPGKALMECSGNDVHAIRSATVNNARNPKFLAILPGLMSIKQQQRPSRSATSQTQESVQSETKTEATILGRLEGANSDEPTLKLDGGLTFQGARVKSSSRFLLLSLQPRTGKVTCKHVFSEVSVFGNAKATDLPKDNIAVEADSVEDDIFRHYGASLRAQGVTGEKLLCSAAFTPVAPKLNIQPESGSDEEFAMNVSPKVIQRPQSKRRSTLTKKFLDSDEDSSSESSAQSAEDEASDMGDSPKRLPPSRKSRRSSVQNAKSLKMDSSEEEENYSDDEEEDEPPVPKKPSKRQRVVELSSSSEDESPKTECKAKRTPPAANGRRRGKQEEVKTSKPEPSTAEATAKQSTRTPANNGRGRKKLTDEVGQDDSISVDAEVEAKPANKRVTQSSQDMSPSRPAKTKPISNTPATSPKRRRGASVKKSPLKKTVIDMTDDLDFKF